MVFSFIVFNHIHYTEASPSHSSEIETTQHIARALNFMSSFTHIINIRFVNEEKHIEDNGSRIVNPYFQEMMDEIFQYVIRNYAMKHRPKSPTALIPYIHQIGFWDLELRYQSIRDFLNSNPHPA